MAVVAAEAAQRAAQEALDRELMPPPAPPVTRRDVLEQEERLVPKSPPVRLVRSPQELRPLETIAEDLNKTRDDRRVADAVRLETEFYNALSSWGIRRGTLPSNAQEKYEVLRDLLQHWRRLGARFSTFYAEMEREYRHVFESVRSQFDDPAAQMAADLDL